MLDKVTSMRVLVRVAGEGSLSAAGRALGLSQTAVTKHVNALEQQLGVRLLHRSTRRLTLTEAGRNYLEACLRILADIDEADQAAAERQAKPRGQLRMNVPVAFGTLWVAPLLAEFTTRYPAVTIDIGLNDRVVDLIEEGWDLAVRIGVLPNSRLVSRRLAPCPMVVCASPAYLDAHGRPAAVADLRHHNCLGYTLSNHGANRWAFGKDGSTVMNVSGTMQTNNGAVLRAAALAGLGLIYEPLFLVADDLRTGRLLAIDLDHPPRNAGQIQVVFPQDRHLPFKSRVMIDFLVEKFGTTPPWAEKVNA